MPTDVIDRILGIAPGSPLAEIRAVRPDVVKHTQGAYNALFAPRNAGRLDRATRLAAALRMAVLMKDAGLAEHYRAALADAKLAAAAEQGADKAGDARLAAILRHVERVTAAPGAVQAPQLKELQAAGLDEHDVVALSQLIAYVNYQARAIAGLRLIRGN